ncbi:MAG: beta-propeller domain-containing protein, partial [Acidimicrobiia bacterium]
MDEPDLVKTDGRRIFTVAGGRLWSSATDGPGVRVLDSPELPDGGTAEILLSGNRVLVLSGTSGARLASRVAGAVPSGSTSAQAPGLARDFAPGPVVETATLTLVDATDEVGRLSHPATGGIGSFCVLSLCVMASRSDGEGGGPLHP